jgi:hypothetical protein
MLAKNLSAPRGTWFPALSLTSIASKLAPTEFCVVCETCRSELAREKPESAAGCLVSRVIVDDHRERARSYRVLRRVRNPVGASMLAKNPSAPRGVWFPASSLTTIASKLAPTGACGVQKRGLTAFQSGL